MKNAMPLRTVTRPPDGALLRLTIDSSRWAESLPPPPLEMVVTVSFASPAALHEHGEALELLGYRVVGVAEQPDLPGPPLPESPAGVADFLVVQPMIEAHPTWWRALADHADRIYNLALGPVSAMLWPVLVTHLGRDAITLP